MPDQVLIVGLTQRFKRSGQAGPNVKLAVTSLTTKNLLHLLASKLRLVLITVFLTSKLQIILRIFKHPAVLSCEHCLFLCFSAGWLSHKQLSQFQTLKLHPN